MKLPVFRANSMRIASASADLRYGVFGENELDVAAQTYVTGKVTTAPARSMVIRDPNTNEVCVKSENMTEDQLKKEAIEAAQLYLLNYTGEGDILIMGDDKDQASRIHAVLLAIDPTLPVKNYVAGAEKPEDEKFKTHFYTRTAGRQEAFIKEQLGDGAKTFIDTYRKELSQVREKNKQKETASAQKSIEYKAKYEKQLGPGKSKEADELARKKIARGEQSGVENQPVLPRTTPRR